MVATCERHLYCLNLIEKSPEEYKLPKSDKEQTSGRELAPKTLFDIWIILLKYLFKKAIKLVNYIMWKTGITDRVKISIN